MGPEFLAKQGIDGGEVRYILKARDFRFPDRLKGPEPAIGIGEIGAGREGLRFGGATGRAFGDPAAESFEMCLRYFLPLFGHLALRNQAEQGAVAGIAGGEQGFVVLGFTVHEPPEAEVDAALGILLLAVAVGAMFF